MCRSDTVLLLYLRSRLQVRAPVPCGSLECLQRQPLDVVITVFDGMPQPITSRSMHAADCSFAKLQVLFTSGA
jgi:hypothetical protein